MEKRKLLRKHAAIHRKVWIYGKTAKIMDEWRAPNDELRRHGFGKPQAGIGGVQKSGILLSEPLKGVIVTVKARYHKWALKSNKGRNEAAIKALDELMTSRPYYTTMTLPARSSKAKDEEWTATYSRLYDQEIRKTQIWQDVLYCEHGVKAKLKIIGDVAAAAADRIAARDSLKAFKETLANTNEMYGVNKRDHTMPMDPIKALCDTDTAESAEEWLGLIAVAMDQLGLGEFAPSDTPQPDTDDALEILK
ncbi:hypothetical protein LTR95_002275 [Oleoguttula sp. CCFEE 5521]